MKIINTCDKIKSVFIDGFSIDLWRKYAEEISKELPSKCEKDAKEYDFNKSVLPVLEAALNEEKLDFVSRNFQTVIDTLNDNLSKLFDKEPDINIILYLGLCNGAGWATTLDGKDTVLLGLEKIIELDWGDETNMRALILHEIGHLWHKLNGNLHIPECVSVKHHKGCDKKTVKKAWIEDIVVDSIRRLIMNDETIEYLTDQALETFNKESTVLPILQKQYAQTLTAINNLITAMEKGIITPTTKERMEELEAEKSELSIRIMKEEMSRPKLTREEILYWFYKFRKLNPNKLDHRRTLINNFVNSVFLFEDRMVITFNFKDGTETITFADLEKSALGSDLKVSGAP